MNADCPGVCLVYQEGQHRRKLTFPHPQQLSINRFSVAGVGLHSHPSSSIQKFCVSCACAGPVHASTIAMGLSVHLSCCVSETMLPWSYLIPLPLTVFHLWLKHRFLKCWGEECYIDIPFKAKISKVSYSLNTDQLCVSVLIDICFEEKLWWWGLCDTLKTRYSSM